MATLRLGAFTKSLRGKAGNTVFVETKLGTVARDRSFPTGEATPAQQAVRNNMKKDGAAWQALSAQSAQNWGAFAAKMTLKAKKSGKPFVPNGYQIFTALTTKWLQIHGGGTAPTEPPTGEFAGDSITVSAVAGSGSIAWTGSGASATGVQAELLLQPLKGKHRKAGTDGYVSQGFFAFTAAGQTLHLSAPVGYWAAAYRFVETASGRETGIVPIGLLTVALAVEQGGLLDAAHPTPAPPQGEGRPARKKAA